MRILSFCFLVLLTSCTKEPIESVPDNDIPTIRSFALKAHVDFLADDLLEGRATGQRGYQIAARYVASHFAQFELKPTDDNQSFLQEVPLREHYLDQESASFSVSFGNKKMDFDYPNEFLTGASRHQNFTQISAPLVFLGYGISAPELGHDDYEGVDVNGKIVVMVRHKPSALSNEEGTHFASSSERAKAAARKGAVGMVFLQTPQSEKRYSYKRMLKHAGQPSLSWVDEKGNPGNVIEGIKGSVVLNIEAAEKLFQTQEMRYSELLERMDNDQPLPHFDMQASAFMEKKTKHKSLMSHNIVGVVEGTDPLLKDEYVLYSAHLDHVGVDHDDPSIVHNGAMDNAVGTSILIETARAFSLKPGRRSVLFIAVTGEEKGLLGSDYYAHFPTVPIKSIVANINLDMPLILYPIGDIIAFGAEHSTLNANVNQAAMHMGLQVSPDPMPEQNIFIRSDHYSFVKKGVPSIFLFPGFKSIDKNISGEEKFHEFFENHYHQPSDDLSLPIDYQAGVIFSQVNFLIGQDIANQNERPRWHEGDFFGDTFSNTQKVE